VKLKLVLQTSGQDCRDLVVTADSSTTVGELAGYLRLADPQRADPCWVAPAVSAPATGGTAVDALVDADARDDGDLTLALVDQSYRAINARLTVLDSGLRSGATIALTRRLASAPDPGRPVAVGVVVAGPDAGKEFPLWAGTAYIGRGQGAELRLSDSSVSRRHAKLVVSGRPALRHVTPAAWVMEVVDLGSANGISVGGTPVPRSVLTSGDRVRLGDTEIEVRLADPAGGPGADLAGPAPGGFVRSPRIAPLFEGREFDLPDLPERPKPSRMPWLAMLLPALMGMSLFAFTRSPYSLMFMLMSPMMMLGNHVEQRRGGKKDFANLMRDFRQDLEIMTSQIRESLEVEADQRREENPSGAECAETARRLSPLLWTRRHDTPGFLQLRIGLGPLSSRSSMTMPAVGRSTAQAWSELAGSMKGLSVVPDVPVVVDPLSTGAMGVSGDRLVALPAARSLMFQAV
jgi:S-DNA-T family DNA segregation ATPase FtsK/SpoIIIE